MNNSDVPLTFDTLCLAIGDDRTYFKLGNENEPDEPETTTKPAPPAQGTESTSQQSGADETESTAAPDPLPESQAPATVTSELARWRQQALGDVSTRCWRTFESEMIPPALHEQIRAGLHDCWKQSDVQAVFERAQAEPMSKEALKKRVHELFSAVVERGHKAMGEESNTDAE